MTIQQIVHPGKIEPELLKIWDGLAKEKMRACLFNLVVFTRLSERTDYIRDIVQKVSEKYPCRVLFISYDDQAPTPYLKTAVSVVGQGIIACDYIDIGVAGVEHIGQVPFVILPHLVPDLPISLLWAEDPGKAHALFAPLAKLAGRIIFDSESADNLLDFSKAVLALKETGVEIADLNWARTEGWRDLIASLHPEKITKVEMIFNERKTEFFCHLRVQSMYLTAWFASRLGWSFQKATKNLLFTFKQANAQIQSASWPKLGPGTIISVNLSTEDQILYHCSRIPTQYHHVTIQTEGPDHCELPYRYVLGQTATGQSLVTEIITQGTSLHYLDMLRALMILDKDKLC